MAYFPVNFMQLPYVCSFELSVLLTIGVRGGGAGGAAAPPILREIIIFGQFLLKYSGNLWG